MADVELVIKIPEGLKKDFELEQWTALSCMKMKDALMNGTPLPKGHGDLVDVNNLLDRIGLEDNDSNREANIGEIITLNDFDFIPTIIEADKEESEKRKPCINCEEDCEAWAGCPCVYYKAESEE